VQTRAATPDPPNLVVVMADDMRADDLVFAPRLRGLVAKHGVTFANSFASFPLCCPARASFLTGQHAHNHGVLWHGSRYGYGAFDDSRTLATSLSAAGYSTAFIGKYLNRYGPDQSLVGHVSSHRYVPRGWASWQASIDANRHTPGGTYNYFKTPFNVNGRVDLSHFGDYSTNVVGAMARQVVTRFAKQDRPFFAYVNFLAPHQGGGIYEGDDPGRVADDRGHRQKFHTPARPAWVRGHFDDLVDRGSGMPKGGGPSERRVSDQPPPFRAWPEPNARERAALREVTRQRAEAIYVMDREIGRLITQLRRAREWDDTVFVFTSDNGYYLGEHRQRQGKVNPHEPSFRVPLLITGPGLRQRRTTYDPASTVDLSATLLDLGRADAPRPADGHSLVPTLYAGDQGWPTAVLYESINSGGPPRSGDPMTSVGVRTARFKYVHRADGRHMLYDLARDPRENHNVARSAAYLDELIALRLVVQQLRNCDGLGCQVPLPPSLAATDAQATDLGRTYWRVVTRTYGFGPGPRR
jgi:arylsulfatase A-like enzyme